MDRWGPWKTSRLLFAKEVEREGTFEKQYKTKLHKVATALAKVLAAGQTGRFVLTDAGIAVGRPLQSDIVS